LPDDESRPDGRAKRRRTVKAVRRRAEPRGGPSGVPVTERPPRGEPLVGWPERADRRASKPRAATARIRERRRQGAKPHKRWPTWRQAGPLADRDRASPRSSRAPPRGGERTKDWEARGAAERGRGQHVSSTGPAEGAKASHAASDGTGDRRVGASRKRLRAGSLLDGGVNGSIGRTRRRTVGSRPHGRSEDLANTRGQVSCSRGARGTGSSRPRSSSRTPNLRSCWSKL